MPFFRRTTAEVLRRGVGEEPTEERTIRKIGRRTVKVRRVRELPSRPDPAPGRSVRKRRKKAPGSAKKKQARSAPTRPPRTEPLPLPGRKQMLVRVRPHQTQVVVLEGPLLVEHYVHRSDHQTLVGNI